MAHYAEDCWDGEVLTSYGWIECCGIADRSCFDLKRHAEVTGKDLYAYKLLKNPIKTQIIELNYAFKEINKTFRK